MVKILPSLCGFCLVFINLLSARLALANENSPMCTNAEPAVQSCTLSETKLSCSQDPIDPGIVLSQSLIIDSDLVSLPPTDSPMPDILDVSFVDSTPTAQFDPDSIPSPTPTFRPKSTPTSRPTPTPTSLPTPTSTPKSTLTPTSSPTITPTPTATPIPVLVAPDSSTPAAKPTSLNSDLIFTMINDHRLKLGLLSFQKNDQLCQLAESRGPELYGEIFGDSRVHAGFYARKLPYKIIENMVHRSSEAIAFNWWLSSPVHRRAIESNYQFSCGACWGNSCTQLFTSFEPR